MSPEALSAAHDEAFRGRAGLLEALVRGGSLAGAEAERRRTAAAAATAERERAEAEAEARREAAASAARAAAEQLGGWCGLRDWGASVAATPVDAAAPPAEPEKEEVRESGGGGAAAAGPEAATAPRAQESPQTFEVSAPT